MKALTMMFPLAACLALCTPAGAQTEGQADAGRGAAEPSPIFFLIRDAAVQRELGLSDDQIASLKALTVELDKNLFAMRDRDAESSETRQAWRSLRDVLNGRLKKLFSAPQHRRLTQLVLRAEGLRVLGRPKIARALGMNDQQRNGIRGVMRGTNRRLSVLAASDPNRNRNAVTEASNRVRIDENRQILAILTREQQERWAATLGKPFDMSHVRWVGVTAPELEPATAWINSEPLTLEKLRGKVVALHFWAFG